MRRLSPFSALASINRLFELVNLLADEPPEGFIGNGKLFKRTVRHDHGVIVAGGDARHGFLPVARGKGFLAGNEELRMRVKRKKCRAPLLDEMIGHDDHGLCREAEAFHFHRGSGHHGRLSRADAVRQQGVVALKRPPYRIFLVLIEIVPPQKRPVHTRKRQVRSVIGAQADVVERVVIEPGKPLRAFLVLPYPFAEPVLDLLLRLARGNRFLLVHYAGVFVDLVVNGGRASVERVVDQVGSQRPRRPPGRGVADVRFRVAVEGERPGGYGAGMADGDGALRRVEQLRDECLHVAGRNPGGTEAGADIAGQEIDGLYFRQGLDVAAGRTDRGRRRLRRF